MDNQVEVIARDWRDMCYAHAACVTTLEIEHNKLVRAYLTLLAAQQVPREPTGKMLVDGRRAFVNEAEKWRNAASSRVADAFADVAPQTIWREMYDAVGKGEK